MKKILYTLFSLFVLASCTHDDLDIPAPLQQESGDKVKLTFNVNIPEVQTVKTRGFGETATLSSLWLVLFDEQGYYVGKAQAYNADKTSETISDVNMDAATTFYVELNVSQSPRIIHFIGNYDLSTASLAGHENSIISRLNVSGVQDAYWQRINVDEIAKKEGATADDNDLFEGVLPTAMNPVHLLRNFAKITVDASNPVVTGGTFVYTGFDIITTESHGSVAPYNMASDPASFPTFIKSNEDGSLTNKCVSYDDLLAINYTGFIPGASQHENTFDKKKETFSSTLAFSPNVQYIYERNNEDGQTFVIVKGTWDNKDTYYKIDLIREVEGSAVTYFHILRNFHYNIIIKSVEGKGADSAAEAAAGAASNNIFASVELQHLTNIGDGSARLFVNYTSKTLISNAPVTLEFNFLNESGVAENSRIMVQVGEGKVFAQNSNKSYQVDAPVHGSSNVENAGYSYITIHPNTPGTLSEEQVITLYDTATGLQRSVIYTLRNHYEFESVVVGYDETPSAVGDEFEYTFTLPDGIPQSLFPMNFLVEAYPQTIYPNTDTQTVGTTTTQIYQSMPATTLEQSFGYERTVTWEEYTNTNGAIVCGFKVNTPSPNYATVISVSHDLFKTGVATLGITATSGTFSNLTINGVTTGATVPYGIGQDVVVTFDMSLVDPTTLVKITAANMASASSSTGFIEKNADGTFTYTPTRKAGKQTITFKTGTIVSANTVTGKYEFIIQGAEGNTKYGETDILNGDFTNVFFVSQNDLYATLAVSGMSIYTDANYTNQLGQSTYDFTANGNYLTTDISSSTYVPRIDGSLYFKNSDGSRKASITIAQLLDNSHPDELVISDADGNIIKMFSNLSLANANAFGKGNVVTINFDMVDKTTPVNITIKEGTNTSTFYYTPTSDEDNSHSYEYTTLTWNGQISVELNATGYIKAFKEAEERIFNSPTIYMDSNGETFRNVIVTITDENGNQIGTCYANRSGSYNNYTYYLNSFNFNDFSSLDKDTIIVLTYTKEGGLFSDDTIYVTDGDITFGDIVNPSTDFKVKFVKQQ